MNMKEYALRLMPENSSIYKFYEQMDIERISENMERDHGEAALYLMSIVLAMDIPLSVKSIIWHIYIYCFFFLSVVAISYICDSLLPQKYIGKIAAIIYFFTPRIFAEGHYNNKDIVLLSLLLCTTACFISLITKFKWSKLILTALLSGFMMNTRIVGVALWGFLGIAYVIIMALNSEKISVIVKRATIGLFSSLLFYFILTPAMWGGIGPFIKYLVENMFCFSRWDNQILYKGLLWRHSDNPLPRSYLLWMILITTPIYVSVLFVIGNMFLAYDLLKNKMSFFKEWKKIGLVVIDLCFWIPVGIAVVFKSHIYNGWRQFYFVYGTFVIMATYAISCLYNKLLSADKWIKKCFVLVISGCIFVTMIGIAYNHPNQHSYYNILAGDAETSYELDYWNVSFRKGLETLLSSINKDSKQDISISACDGASYWGVKKNRDLVKSDISIQYIDDWQDHWNEADYIMVNRTYKILESNDNLQYVIENYKEVVAIYSYGNKVLSIYMK